MSLLAPLALLGLLGLSLPLFAHLLGREPPTVLRFAAVRFVRPQEPVVTQRRQLRDRTLLLVRLLLLATFVLVLARPVVEDEAAVAVLAEAHDAVVVLDASGSMELRVGGVAERERAVEQLETLLDALPVGSRVGLVISDPRAPTVELGEVSSAAAAIRATVDGWMNSREAGPRPGAWSLSEALAPAAEMLAGGDERPRVIYAIGDATARGLGSLPASVAGTISVIPIPTRGSVAEAAQVPEHVGLRELRWDSAPELEATAVRVRALIHRHGGDDAPATVSVALDIDNDEVARTSVELDADGEASVEFTHTLGSDEAGARATVRLLGDDDPLPVDDRRHLWLTAADAVEVLIINGDPSETRSNDEIFFLATALASSELAAKLRLRGLAVDQLEERLRTATSDNHPLADVDVLVLANVRAPAPELAPLIAERVAAGMGLWITVGDRVSAADYNARFGALLPLLLREAIFTGTAPGRTEARSESMEPVQLSHPLFAGDHDIDLSATRTRRMFLLEPDPRRDVDIAVTFASGAPALLTGSHGQGRVALLTTSIDRDWGDLPLRPGFVPLAVDTLTWLAGAGSRDRASTVSVGASKTLARSAAYAVSTPSGENLAIGPVRDGEPARFEATDQVGHYRARPRDEAGAEPERFVVEFDAREADTAAVVLQARQPVADEAGAMVLHQPRWRELALLLLVLLGIESGLRLWSARATGLGRG